MTIDLKEVGSGFKRTSLNENFIDIEDAINNDLLWRDGSQPMAGSLDMNSERIINLPDAVTDQEPVTLGQASAIAGVDPLPPQAGEAGKYLTTDGASTSWGEGLALPDQSGNSGKFLSTDGTDTLWQDVAVPSSSSYANVTEMFAGDNAVGEVYGAGGTFWRVDSISVPMTIDNYSALSEVNIAAFGALEDGSDVSPACQAAIDYAAPRGYPIRVQGVYSWNTSVYLRSHTSLYFDSSQNTVARNMGSLFIAEPAAGTSIDKVVMHGGNWVEGSATDGMEPSVTFLEVIGDYSGGSPDYLLKLSMNRIRLSRFNWFLKAEYLKTFNIVECYMYTRNGVYLGHKCAEGNIVNNMIYGRDYADATTKGIVIGGGVTATSMYAEGIKITNNGIDGHGTCIEMYSNLDCNITDNWISQRVETEYHCLKVDYDGVNNIYKGININSNTFKRGKIEFVTQTSPPIVPLFQLADNLYTEAQQITIGSYWHDLTFSNWDIERIGGSSGTGIGFLLNYRNGGCKFDSIQFRRDWVRLISVLGDDSQECLINNVWSEDYMDNPFYTETPIRITNSMAPSFPVTSASQGGQVIYTKQLNTATEGNYCAIFSSLRFKVGAMVEISLHGNAKSSTSTGKVEIRPTTSSSAVVESLASGTGWDSKYIDINEGVSRIDASYIFKETTGDSATFVVQAVDGDITWDSHSYLVVKYI